MFTALARTLASIDGTLDVATMARDYGHPDDPAGPVWAPLTRDPEAVRRVRLPGLSTAAAAQHNEPAHADAMPMLTGWMDDESSDTEESAEMIVLDDPDEPWSA